MAFLDALTIGFKSEGLDKFSADLKKNKQELEKYEKETKKLEENLKKLEEQGKKDTEQYKKTAEALEEAKKKTEELSAAVSKMENSTTYKLAQLQKGVMKFAKTVGLIAAVGVAVKKSMDFYEQAEQLDFLAQKTGIAVEKLQELANTAQRYGGTTEGTASTIETLRGHYTEIKKGTASEEITKYKTVFTDNPEQTLENVAAQMEKMKSDTDKWEFAKSIGIDEGTTRLLIQGVDRYREELKRTSKYKLFTKEDVERMKDYRQIQTDIRMGIQQIWSTVASLLLPILTAVAKAVRRVTDFLSEREGAVKLIATFVGITVAISGIIFAVSGVVKVLAVLRAALTLFAANPVTGWIVLIGVLIAGLVAIIQDFIVFLQGGNSVIGGILKKCGVDVGKARKICWDFINSVKNGVKSVIEWITSLGGKIRDVISDVGGKIRDFARKIKELWDKIPDPIKKLISLTNPFTAAFTMVNIAKEGIQRYNQNKLNAVPQGTISNTSQTTAINNSNKSIQNISNQSNSRTVKIDNVNIQTQATDAKGVARDFKQAVNYYDDGMRL